MHSKKTYLLAVMALVLLLSILMVQIRLTTATFQMETREINRILRLSDSLGTMYTRNGEMIYDGQNGQVPVLANLVGGTTKNGTVYIANSLSNRYAGELAPKRIHPISGYHPLKGREGKKLTTTLLGTTAQNLLAQQFENYRGSIFAYNYVTGEIYISLSLPSSLTSGEDSSLVNTPINGTYIPGSTMKIPTVVAALSQQPELRAHQHTCTGEYLLPDGNTVRCHGVHGTIGLVDAVGYSCNCYFASLIACLSVPEAVECLREMGFRVNGEGGFDKPVDELKRSVSSTEFADTYSFQDVWGLIGQGDTAVSPIHMAMIAGAVANDGDCAIPYLVESICDPNGDPSYSYRARTGKTSLMSRKEADTVRKIWENAVREYYTDFPEEITMAKTGTAQTEDGVNRLLMGVIPSRQTAFYIVVENAPSNRYVQNIAKNLIGLLPVVTD